MPEGVPRKVTLTLTLTLTPYINPNPNPDPNPNPRTRIRLETDMPEGVPRKVMITGDKTAVDLATKMVKAVMEHGPAGMATMEQVGFGVEVAVVWEL